MKKRILTVVVLGVMLWGGVVFAQTENGRAMLENPAPNSHQSGVSVISGWACDAQNIVIEIDAMSFTAAYGTMREDTQEVCGDTDNGFSFLWNWSNSGGGEHTVRALSDGVEFGTATVTVTTFGTTFLRAASGSYILDDFPTTGEETRIQWAESLQNFVIRDNPAAFTQDFVQAALDRYDREGREATLAYYNDSASIHYRNSGSADTFNMPGWYVFIVDENDLIVSHPVMPELVGRDIKTIVSSDGYEVGQEIAKATEAGHWIHYLLPYPSTPFLPAPRSYQEEVPTHSWAVRHDGLIFVSSYNEPPTGVVFCGTDLYGYSSDRSDFSCGDYSRVPDIAAVLENPTPRSFRSGVSAISGWACDAEEIVIAINGEPFTAYGTDSDGRPWRWSIAAYGTVREDTAEICGDTDNGFSLLWNWNNLGDGVYAVQAFIDGVPFARSSVTVTTFGDEMLGDEEKTTFTQEFVQAALDRYDQDGREATVAHYNTQASIEGEWYVFIIDENDLYIAHPTAPELVGLDVKTRPGSDGPESGPGIAEATEAGHWVHYTVPNPASGEEEPKHTWVIRHDGLIFASGYYGPPNFQEYNLSDFPTEGLSPSLQWSQPLQNFVITGLWKAIDHYAPAVQEVP